MSAQPTTDCFQSWIDRHPRTAVPPTLAVYLALSTSTSMATTEHSPASATSGHATLTPSTGPQPQVSAAAIPGNASVFDFFRLPRELRDMIYGQPQLLEEKPVEIKSSNALILTATVPRTSLLLVSRQFNQEFSDGCFQARTFSIRQSDMTKPIWSLSPAIAADTTSLKPELIHDDYYPGGPGYMMIWLSEWVKHLPKLESIAITFYERFVFGGKWYITRRVLRANTCLCECMLVSIYYILLTVPSFTLSTGMN